MKTYKLRREERRDEKLESDADLQRRVVERDQACLRCGETDLSILCGHHLVHRANVKARHEDGNSVTVCNAPRLRLIPNAGAIQKQSCHAWAHDHPEEAEAFFAYERPGAFWTRKTWSEFKKSVGAI